METLINHIMQTKTKWLYFQIPLNATDKNTALKDKQILSNWKPQLNDATWTSEEWS